MHKLFIPLLSLVLLVAGISACHNKKDELVLKGDEYFPIKKGSIKYYVIDTFFFNSFTNETDTVSNTYREEVKEMNIDGAGDTSYRVELSLFNTVRNKWEARQSFSRKISGNYAIETIDNKPEVKLLFPISKYKTKGSSYVWNLNMLTNQDITNVKYVTLFKSYNNGVASFNDCVTVELQSPESGVINNIREEVYANGTGLVYRHIDKSDYLDMGQRSGFEIFVRLKP